jgi:predicted nucleotidyltransferase
VDVTERPGNTEELRSRLAAALPGLRGRYPIRTLGVFGSWARGEQTPESDVDLLVEFDGVVTYFEVLALEDELRALLGVRVDLATPGALKRFIGERIRSELLPV